MRPNEDIPKTPKEALPEARQSSDLLRAGGRPNCGEGRQLIKEIWNLDLHDASGQDVTIACITITNNCVKRAGCAPHVKVPVISNILKPVKKARLPIATDEGDGDGWRVGRQCSLRRDYY